MVETGIRPALLPACRHELEGMLRRQRTQQELRAVQAQLDAVDDERQAHCGVFAHRAGQAGGRGRAGSGLVRGSRSAL